MTYMTCTLFLLRSTDQFFRQGRWLQCGLIAGLATLALLGPWAFVETYASSLAVPHNSNSVPTFTLGDSAGVRRSLTGYRGRSIALFFFCGCPWCQGCARQWGEFQRGGVLPAAAPSHGTGQPPVTLVVFSGDAGEARAFATQTGLDMRQTVLLLDPDLRVTLGLYHAEPCPRVFVLDGGGRERYTNDHSYDLPRRASALAITSRVLTALRVCTL